MTSLTTLIISGQVGAGKSLATHDLGNFFSRLGISVLELSLDEVGHRVLVDSARVKDALINYFGSEIIDVDGEVSRKKLAQKAFASPENLELLNKSTHPAIAHAAQKSVAAFAESHSEGIVIIETPFPISYLQEDALFAPLIENAISLAICADREVRRSRKDSLTPEEFDRRDALQESEDVYTEGANFVLDNSGSLEEFRCALDEFGRGLLR